MKNIITWKDFLNEEINSKKILMSGALVGGLMSSEPALSQNVIKNQAEPIQSTVVKQEEYIEQNEWVFNHNFGFGETAIRLKSDKNIKYQKQDQESILEKIKKELEKIGLSVYDMAKRAGSAELKGWDYYEWNGIKIYIQQKDNSSIDIYKVEWWVPTTKEVWYEIWHPIWGVYVPYKKVEDKWIQINVNKSGGVWQGPVIPGTYQDECPILPKEKNEIETNNLLSPKELRKEMRRIQMIQMIQKERSRFGK